MSQLPPLVAFIMFTFLFLFVFLSGVLEVQLLDTANLSLDSPDLDDAALDGGDSSVFLFSNVQLTQQVRLD